MYEFINIQKKMSVLEKKHVNKSATILQGLKISVNFVLVYFEKQLLFCKNNFFINSSRIEINVLPLQVFKTSCFILVGCLLQG